MFWPLGKKVEDTSWLNIDPTSLILLVIAIVVVCCVFMYVPAEDMPEKKLFNRSRGRQKCKSKYKDPKRLFNFEQDIGDYSKGKSNGKFMKEPFDNDGGGDSNSDNEIFDHCNFDILEKKHYKRLSKSSKRNPPVGSPMTRSKMQNARRKKYIEESD